MIAEHDEGTQAWPDRSQQLDDHMDVLDLFADVAGDAQQVGRESLERSPLYPKQPPIAAAYVRIADVDDRQLRPGLRQAQAMTPEDGSVGFSHNGVAHSQSEHRDQRQQRGEQHDAALWALAESHF